MDVNPKSYQAYNLLHQGILAFARAEQAGIRVDVEYIERKKVHLTRKIAKLEEKFKDTTFFKHWEHATKGKVNIDSSVQLGYFLYRIKKLEPPKLTATGNGSTDEEALKQLNIPELDILLERDKLKRLRDVNLEGFAREQVDGYIHPFFNLHLVRTYRSSCDSPNAQNIPVHDEESMNIVRKAIFPRPGHQLMEIDYSGLEFRIVACYSKDKEMIKYINDPKSDIHGDTAKGIFKIDHFDKSIPYHKVLRQAAKNSFIFPEIYGDFYKSCAYNVCSNWIKLPQGKWKSGMGIEMEEGHISDHLISKGITSFDRFMDHMEDVETSFRKKFKGHWEWIKSWEALYRKNGYIDMYTGFRCSGMMKLNNIINYPVQGASFHCNFWSFIELDKVMRKEKWDSRLIGQIHDSIIFDCLPSETRHVYETAKRISTVELPKIWDWIIVPLDVEAEVSPVDGSWAEKEKLII
jgi:DNA polymerase-1